MKYFFNSAKFIKKAWYILIVVNIVPAIFLGLYTVPFNSVAFLPTYYTTNVNNFGDVLSLVFSVAAFKKIYPWILIAISCVVFVSIGYSVVEKYTKTNKIMLTQPISGLNFALMPALFFLSVSLVVIFLIKIIIASLTIVLHLLISKSGVPTVLDSVVVTAVALAVICFAVCFFMSMFLWMPIMSISGYLINDTLTYSIRLAYKDAADFFFSIFLPMVAMIAVQITITIFCENWIEFSAVIRIMIYLFILTFVESFSVLSYEKLRC